jgi:hypothetical protein
LTKECSLYLYQILFLLETLLYKGHLKAFLLYMGHPKAFLLYMGHPKAFLLHLEKARLIQLVVVEEALPYLDQTLFPWDAHLCKANLMKASLLVRNLLEKDPLVHTLMM